MSKVAPFTGARIETDTLEVIYDSFNVAPFTGARIETHSLYIDDLEIESLPSRERGLKPQGPEGLQLSRGRSLHGSAD